MMIKTLHGGVRCSDTREKIGRGPAYGRSRDSLVKLSRCSWKMLAGIVCLGCFLIISLSFRTEAKAELIERKLASSHLQDLQKPPSENAIMVPVIFSHSALFNPYSTQTATDPDVGRIHVPSQPTIQKYVHRYQKQDRKTFKKALQHSLSYIPLMSDILKSYGLPPELVYVVLVESRFKNGTLSEKGAAGYWQLMPRTARSLGLRVDPWVDERMDLIKSTCAAAQYLRMLYDRFNSWSLALAAYNIGETTLTQVIKKQGRNNFWELSRRRALPQEAREYVPKVFAAILIARNLESYGFNRPRHLPVYTFDSVQVWNPLDLQLVARWVDTSVTHLRALNPSLLRDRLPPGKESFILHLPIWGKDKFNTAYEDYLNHSHGKNQGSKEN